MPLHMAGCAGELHVQPGSHGVSGVLWKHNPLTNRKQIDGTFWMNYRANMYQIKSDLKEVSRLNKKLRLDVGRILGLKQQNHNLLRNRSK